MTQRHAICPVCHKLDCRLPVRWEPHPRHPEVSAAPCDICGWPANLPTLDSGAGWRLHPGKVYNYGTFNAHERCKHGPGATEGNTDSR